MSSRLLDTEDQQVKAASLAESVCFSLYEISRSCDQVCLYFVCQVFFYFPCSFMFFLFSTHWGAMVLMNVPSVTAPHSGKC